LPYRLEVTEYRALIPELQAYGAAPLSVVGSSRAREGVASGELERRLAQHGTRIEVANYALASAQAEENEIVVERLLELDPPPKLIVYAFTARQLATKKSTPSDKVGYLWRVSDWWDARRRVGSSADALLPRALRNELRARSHLFRLREEVLEALQQPTPTKIKEQLAKMVRKRETMPPSPMRGDLTPWQRGKKANRSIRVSHARVRRYLKNRYREPEWPWTYQAAHLERLAERCEAAGVPLVFAELPMSPALAKELPDGTRSGTLEVMSEIAGRHGATVVEVSDLGVRFTQKDFREQSHLNRRGARKYSHALADQLDGLL
jgi:hypothetical protein